MRRKTITIIYKSGTKVRIRCKNFTIRTRSGEIVEVEWDSIKPRPLHIGVDEIVAVYNGRA